MAGSFGYVPRASSSDGHPHPDPAFNDPIHVIASEALRIREALKLEKRPSAALYPRWTGNEGGRGEASSGSVRSQGSPTKIIAIARREVGLGIRVILDLPLALETLAALARVNFHELGCE
jgi:hypothetical protein